MNECYYIQCPHHPQDEPFCGIVPCSESTEDLAGYAKLRTQERQNEQLTTQQNDV